MKPKLLVVYVALIVLPLAILGWLGARAIGQERDMLDRNIEGLLVEQMGVYDAKIQRLLASWISDWKSTFLSVSDGDLDREILNRDGRITHFFVVDGDGALVYPVLNELATSGEQEFIERTKTVWSSGAIHLNQLSDPNSGSVYSLFESIRVNSYVGPATKRGDWYEWYWGDGLQLLYWWPSKDGNIYGVEVNRIRLLADMIGELPDTSDELDGQGMATRLLNESGHLLYQWGGVAGVDEETPSYDISLSAPLGSWSLHASMTNFSGRSAGNVLLLGVGLACLALVLAGLGIYFYRENTRELREAAERVNFVNHVSHELKTPLTNIRMYAELLQEQMGDEREEESGRLGVILSESQRLSRLITNVLTFNRKERSALTLHATRVDVDALLGQVLSHFKKSFEQHGIEVLVEGGISGEVWIDPDVFEQIVGNLLSNVEKYARGSGEVRIGSALVDGMIEITVADEGPGISGAERDAVFGAFYRVEDALTEGVSGTGIGLSIARDLARLHGGDIELVPSESGACFRVRLAVQGEG